MAPRHRKPASAASAQPTTRAERAARRAATQPPDDNPPPQPLKKGRAKKTATAVDSVGGSSSERVDDVAPTAPSNADGDAASISPLETVRGPTSGSLTDPAAPQVAPDPLAPIQEEFETPAPTPQIAVTPAPTPQTEASPTEPDPIPENITPPDTHTLPEASTLPTPPIELAAPLISQLTPSPNQLSTADSTLNANSEPASVDLHVSLCP